MPQSVSVCLCPICRACFSKTRTRAVRPASAIAAGQLASKSMWYAARICARLWRPLQARAPVPPVAASDSFQQRNLCSTTSSWHGCHSIVPPLQRERKYAPGRRQPIKKLLCEADRDAAVVVAQAGDGGIFPEPAAVTSEVIVAGWVRTVRAQKHRAFAHIDDGSCAAGLQVRSHLLHSANVFNCSVIMRLCSLSWRPSQPKSSMRS